MSSESAVKILSPADINSVHDAHVARLDADMFTADDIDGVTEGISGSGNLNYLVLQSQQTNESFQVADPFNIDDGGFSGDPLSSVEGAKFQPDGAGSN